MGLDQFAYAGIGDEKEELTYWRKHNRLHGWMEKLWESKGSPHNDLENPSKDFNCCPVEVTLADIEQLEAHVENKSLPETGGFFFGSDSFAWTDDDGNEFTEGY